LEKPNSILRQKRSFALKTGRKFGRRWSCPAVSQGNCSASEESKRNAFPGTSAKSRKLTSILKYHFAFPGHLKNYLEEAWP